MESKEPVNFLRVVDRLIERATHQGLENIMNQLEEFGLPDDVNLRIKDKIVNFLEHRVMVGERDILRVIKELKSLPIDKRESIVKVINDIIAIAKI